MPLANHKIQSLRDQVREMLKANGMSLEDLQASASEIIVFGSRASGLHRPDSDLDLLIITDRSGHRKIGSLDLIFVPQTRINSTAWRRTEIARHIAEHGISLMGDRVRIAPIIDDYAAMRKQARLQRLIRRLLPCWHLFDEGLRLKYLTRVRRELQRYRVLEEGLAVPATAALDSILDLPNWPDVVFEDLEKAADLSRTEAELASQILIKEARRIQRKIKRSRAGNRNRAA